MINRNVSQENLQRNSFLLLWAVWDGRERMWKWEETTLSQWSQRNSLWSSQSTSFLLWSFFKVFSLVCLFTLEDIKVWGFFFIFECCFSSFLNLKDLIFYNNSQMHTSNSDFLSKHTWTYRKIKICFDSHPCFSFFLFQITLNCLDILLALL